MTKRKKWCILVAAALLAVLALPAWWAGDRALASRTLDAKKEELRQAGYAVSLSDVWPPPAHEGENAALPYEAAISAFQPMKSSPSDYVWNVFIMEDPQARAEMDQLLAVNERAASLVRSARTRPRCRYDRDFLLHRRRSHDEYKPALDLIELLTLKAIRSTAAGHLTNAAEEFKDALALAASYRDEPVLQSQTLYYVGTASVLEAMRLWIGSASAAQLEMFRDLVPAPESARGCAARGLRGELAWTSEVVSGPADLIWELDPKRARLMDSWTRFKLTPTLKRDGAAQLDRLRRAIDACETPWPQAKKILMALSEEHLDESLETRPVAHWLDINYFIELRDELTMVAKLVVVRAGLEAELAWVRDGKYPETVGGIDPFTGKPIIYNPEKRHITCDGPKHGEGVRMLSGTGFLMDSYGESEYSWFLYHAK